MATNIGPKIEIDGYSEYRQSINNLIQQTKTLDSEMKLLSASFTKNTTAKEKNKATSELLAKQLELQQKKVEEISKVLEKAKGKYDENSNEVLKWKQALLNAQTSAKNIENQIESLGDELDKSDKSFADAGKSAISFGDILKANIAADFIVGAVKEIASALKDFSVNAINAAAEVKAQNSQYTQTFGDMAEQATAAIRKVASDSNILDTRLKGVATSIYSFAKASGGTAPESLALTEKALQATADSAAYYDKSLEDTAETLQSFLKGNYENDAALGLSATEATRNAKAFEMFGDEFNNLTEIQKQQTLLQMVLDAQELSGAMGQAAREADGWENVQGNLNEAWKQFTAKIGTPILESVIPVVKNITSGLMDLTNSLNGNSLSENISSLSSAIISMAPNVLNVGKDIISSISSGIISALPMLMTTAQTMMSSFITYLKENLPTIISTGVETMVGFSSGLKDSIGGLVDTGIEVIMTLVNGIVEAMPALIENIPLIVSNIANIINENLPKILMAAVNIIITLVTGLIQNIPVILENLPQIIMAIADTIMAFNWLSIGSSIISGVANGITNLTSFIADVAGKTFSEVGKAAINVLKSLPSQAIQWGKDFIAGFVNGILGSIGSVINAVSSIASTVASYLHFSRPDVGPLHYYEEWMPDFMQGLAKGIKGNTGLVESAVKSLSEKMVVNANVNTVPVRSYGRGVVIENITINGYDDFTSQKIVREVNRALGRIYI